MTDLPAPGSPAPLTPAQRQAMMDVIFRTFGHSRFTQDSPLRPDVWMAFWERLAMRDADARVDLILTPDEGSSAGRMAVALEAMLADSTGPLAETGSRRARLRQACRIAYSRTTVQAALTAEQALTAVIALSAWWEQRAAEAEQADRAQGRDEDLACGARALQRVREFRQSPGDQALTVNETIARQQGSFQFYRFAALASLTLLLREDPDKAMEVIPRLRDGNAPLASLLDSLGDHLATALTEIDAEKRRLVQFEASNPDLALSGRGPRLRSAAVNRSAGNAVYVSRRTVKVDATQTLFRVNTTGIVWAVIDCGIDARHPAFFQQPVPPAPGCAAASQGHRADWPALTRIQRSYDLTFLRELLTFSDYPDDPPDLAGTDSLHPDAAAIRRTWTAFVAHKKKTQAVMLDRLAQCRDEGLTIGWEILGPLVEVPHEDAVYRPPHHEHGTHVAGILAAAWPDCPPFADTDEQGMMGACPDLRLVDIRAFDAQGQGREDTVIEAIDLIRFLNRQGNRLAIHGANLSLAVTHDVQAYGCGQTPVCAACNDLVRSGVVVVAAAGNSGHEGEAALGSTGQSTRDISITDPGNAELVITVGSTHRQSPFAYGISYFSSRGPTADGRIKPDLVAPGEKICGPIPLAGNLRPGYKILDGTSMAAPHVSGVAALLMARNRELIGEPLRIKEILRRTATDLGRIPAFQGAGLVDALRALQSI